MYLSKKTGKKHIYKSTLDVSLCANFQETERFEMDLEKLKSILNAVNLCSDCVLQFKKEYMGFVPEPPQPIPLQPPKVVPTEIVEDAHYKKVRSDREFMETHKTIYDCKNEDEVRRFYEIPQRTIYGRSLFD
jgi:hypothetical protein